jgi:hypothetical protein
MLYILFLSYFLVNVKTIVDFIWNLDVLFWEPVYYQ